MPASSVELGRGARPRLPAGHIVVSALVVLQAVLIVLLLTRSFEIGSGTGGYLFPYVRTAGQVPVLPYLVTGAIIPALAVALRWIRRQESVTVVAWLLFGGILQTILQRQASPVTMRKIVRGDQYDDFLNAAERYSVTGFLRHFDTTVPNLPDAGFLHVKSNMPGKVVLLDLFDGLLGTGPMLGWTVAILSLLGAALVYGVARLAIGDPESSLVAMTLYLVMPGRLGFLPVMNTVSPIFILGTFLLVLLYVRSGRRWSLWALGPALYLSLLFEPLPMVMLGVVAAVAAGAFVQRGRRWSDAAVAALGPISGFLIMYVAFRLAVGFELVGALRHVANNSAEYNRTVRPHYSDWFLPNLREFTLSTGIAVVGVAVLACSASLAPVIIRKRSVAEALRSPAERFTLATLVTLLLLLVAGVNRGEVGRLWIFLGVFFCIVAGWACTELLPRWASYAVVTATGIQAVTLTSMVLLPVTGFFNPKNIARSTVFLELSLLLFVAGSIVLAASNPRRYSGSTRMSGESGSGSSAGRDGGAR